MASKGRTRVDEALRALADYSANLPEPALLAIAPILERVVRHAHDASMVKAWAENAEVKVNVKGLLAFATQKLRKQF